jgi:aminopeptidase
VQPGEKVLVECFDIPEEFICVLTREVAEAGGLPIVDTKHNRVLRELYRNASAEQMQFIGAIEKQRMEGVQCYMGVRGSHNITEMSDVPSEKMKLYQEHWWEVVHTRVRVPKTKWVVLRWPHPSMAQAASMSTEAFENFYFDVCCADYAKMSAAMHPLVERMNNTDRVRITGPGTDLSFSIKDIPAVGCSGEMNIPDGEVFTAPVRDSVNGTLRVNTETLYQGTVFKDIRLLFKDGRIVEAEANETEKLNSILDSDEGGRYIGEFAIGFNPYVLHPMKDTLFDEKIAGSFHFTPGNAYEEADNGNRSQIHWDMVIIQRPDYGGGEMFFDDALVRKDGLFCAPELEGMNPENLR